MHTNPNPSYSNSGGMVVVRDLVDPINAWYYESIDNAFYIMNILLPMRCYFLNKSPECIMEIISILIKYNDIL